MSPDRALALVSGVSLPIEDVRAERAFFRQGRMEKVIVLVSREPESFHEPPRPGIARGGEGDQLGQLQLLEGE